MAPYGAVLSIKVDALVSRISERPSGILRPSERPNPLGSGIDGGGIEVFSACLLVADVKVR